MRYRWCLGHALLPTDHILQLHSVTVAAITPETSPPLATKLSRTQQTNPTHNPRPTPHHTTYTATNRAREKVNRPQTRRRRDNSDELMDKMRLLQTNLSGAKQIMEEVVRRERRKRDLAVGGASV